MRRLVFVQALLLLLAVSAECRDLRATPTAKQPTEQTNPAKKQFVQFVVNIADRTCASLPANFNNTFRVAARADARSWLARNYPTSVLRTIGARGQPCADITWQGRSYAGLRTSISFNGTNSTLTRDFLSDSARDGICAGKYRTDVWIKVNNAMVTNNLNVAYNNGSRQSPNGKNGWIPYNIPQSCSPLPSPSPQLPSPTPSPAPIDLPSPSPAPAGASPSPSPSPTACSSIPNSVQQADGSCKCTATGFTMQAFNGANLAACLPTSTTVCQAPYSVSVKDNTTPVPTLLKCLTPSSTCADHAPYIFPLYSGNPSALTECRLPVVDCTYTPFTMKITSANGTLIGCVNPAAGGCPFVAFRQAVNTYALEFCRQVTTCPTYAPAAVPPVTSFVVPGRGVNGELRACLTLGTDNACPALVGLADFPVEVTVGDPGSCGASNLACQWGNPFPRSQTRVEECLATGAPCDPQKFPLQVMRPVGLGATVPQLVNCRQARPFPGQCDLSVAGMNGNSPNADPNADSYTIPIYQTAGNLVGCIRTGTSECPISYPVAVRVNNQLQECRPATNATNPCAANSAAPVPATDANGNWLNVCLQRRESCLVSYPDYPVTIRDAIGDMIQCRKQVTKCPTTEVTNGVTTVVPSFPLFASTAPGVQPVITNCYPPATVGNTCTITIDAGRQYYSPIRNATGQLLGCLQQGGATTVCPADAPFAWYNGTTLLQCAPLGQVTSCPAQYIPATDLGVLIGCVIPIAGTPTRCPTAVYPVSVATEITANVLECMTARSTCLPLKTTQPFSLVKDGQLAWCINPQQSITSCSQVSTVAVDPNWFGPPVMDPTGTSVIGCIYNSPTPSNCPAPFPFIFRSSSTISPRNGTVYQCRAGISAPDCPSAVVNFPTPTNEFTVPILNGSSLVGCAQVTGDCSTGVAVAATATGQIERCLTGPITSCDGVTNNFGQLRPFPIYSGVDALGNAKLVRCIAPIVQSDCSGTSLGNSAGTDYRVPIYNSTEGSGLVIGCVRNTAQQVTPCPSTAPFYLVGQGASSPLAACIQTRPACNITSIAAWTPYTTPLTSQNGATVLGCMLAGATACPATGSGSPYSFAFPLFGAGGIVSECRLLPNNPLLDCTAYAPYSVPIVATNITASTVPVVGCSLAGVQCTMSGYAVTLWLGPENNTQPTSCRPTGFVCGAPYSIPFFGPTGAVEGCWQETARRRALLATVPTGCPTNAPASKYSKPTFNTAGSTTQPTGCWNINATSCSFSAGYTVPLYENAASTGGVVEGCANTGATICPTSWSALYSVAWDGTTQTLNACFSTGGACPANTISVVSGTNMTGGTVVGCITATGNGTLACPVTIGGSVGFNNSMEILNSNGTIVQCRANLTACGGSYPVELRSTDLLTLMGCTAAASNACPGAGAIASYTYFYYDKTSAVDATPSLKVCTPGTNGVCNATITVAGVGYGVDVWGQIAGNTTSRVGCISATSQCPASHSFFVTSTWTPTPVAIPFSSTPSIAQCHLAGATTCPAVGQIPVSSGTASNSSGTLVGCLDVNSNRCFNSINNYPTTTSYSTFLAISSAITATYPTGSALVGCRPPFASSSACQAPYNTWAGNNATGQVSGCVDAQDVAAEQVNLCDVYFTAYMKPSASFSCYRTGVACGGVQCTSTQICCSGTCTNEGDQFSGSVTCPAGFNTTQTNCGNGCSCISVYSHIGCGVQTMVEAPFTRTVNALTWTEAVCPTAPATNITASSLAQSNVLLNASTPVTICGGVFTPTSTTVECSQGNATYPNSPSGVNFTAPEEGYVAQEAANVTCTGCTYRIRCAF